MFYLKILKYPENYVSMVNQFIYKLNNMLSL